MTPGRNRGRPARPGNGRATGSAPVPEQGRGGRTGNRAGRSRRPGRYEQRLRAMLTAALVQTVPPGIYSAHGNTPRPGENRGVLAALGDFSEENYNRHCVKAYRRNRRPHIVLRSDGDRGYGAAAVSDRAAGLNVVCARLFFKQHSMVLIFVK